MESTHSEGSDVEGDIHRLYGSMVDLSWEELFLCDRDGLIVLANLRAARAHGFISNEKMAGLSALDLIAPVDRGRMLSCLRTASESTAAECSEYSLIGVDGALYQVEASFSPLPGPSGKMLILFRGRDLVREKAMERELRDYALTMEELVAERTKQLEVEKNRVQELLEMKTQFVNQLSHDLRTPLTPIITMLPLIGERMRDEKDKKLFKLVMKNVNYINDLAVATLTLARLDAKRVIFEAKELDLHNLVDELFQNNRTSIDLANMRAENAVPKRLKVRTDELRIMEVLNNLLGNSLKYAYGTSIAISAKETDGAVEVSVADSGMGIPADKMGMLFTEFYKADNSRHEMSSGLGLAICKRIVEAQGGRIWAHSEGAGRGTTFKFTLPRA